MGRVHSLEFKLKKQTLSTGQWFAAVYLLLDEHELRQDVVDYTQMSVWIILVGFHNLSTCVSHSRWLTDASSMWEL